MRRILGSCANIAFAAIISLPLAAQSFEVASIRLATFPGEAYFRGFTSATKCGKGRVTIQGRSFTVEKANLCGLIREAYDVREDYIDHFPEALRRPEPSNYFDIQAQAGEGTILTPQLARTMLQALLSERFGLKVHRELREPPVYALVVAKNGHKLSSEPLSICGDSPIPKLEQKGQAFGNCKPSLTISHLVLNLTGKTDRPVIDRTGLDPDRGFAFFLQWSPEGMETAPNAAPGLFTALEEQLGWKLEAVRSTVELVVVDAAHGPTEN